MATKTRLFELAEEALAQGLTPLADDVADVVETTLSAASAALTPDATEREVVLRVVEQQRVRVAACETEAAELQEELAAAEAAFEGKPFTESTRGQNVPWFAPKPERERYLRETQKKIDVLGKKKLGEGAVLAKATADLDAMTPDDAARLELARDTVFGVDGNPGTLKLGARALARREELKRAKAAVEALFDAAIAEVQGTLQRLDKVTQREARLLGVERAARWAACDSQHTQPWVDHVAPMPKAFANAVHAAWREAGVEYARADERRAQ